MGTPKSGTTFLQKVLWDNPDTLLSQGFRCAGTRQKDMFLAAIEVRESHEFWGYPPEELAGRWTEVCRQAHAHPGTTILSHEVLGAASEEQAARALAELAGVELHLVLTARDLARQVTSEWQERIKNGSASSFADFERGLRRQMSNGNFDKGFWRNQDPVGVLDRWARDLPPDQVHVVVAPPSASDPGLLWVRFAEAVGIDASTIDPMASQRAANTTLGVAQVAVLRQVNAALDGRIRQPEYARVVKHRFAERLLAQQTSPRPQCPPDLVALLRELAEQRNRTLRERGYTVHGDLAELVPVDEGSSGSSPDDVDPEALRDAYADAIATLLVRRAGQGQQRPPRSDVPQQPPGSPLRRTLGSLGERIRGRR